MLRYDEKSSFRSFSDLGQLFYGSLFFSLVTNSLATFLTFAYLEFGWGRELNPVMAIELRVLGAWVLPFHIVSILVYYILFYFTMKHTRITGGSFKLWCLVLILIPVLSSFDLAFDLKSAF
jgi:hypothetical protein